MCANKANIYKLGTELYYHHKAIIIALYIENIALIPDIID